MTRAEDFMKKQKCETKFCLPMLISAWCHLNAKRDTLKLHDMCSNPECKCQKKITFTPREFQHDGAGFRNKMKKTFRAGERVWNLFLIHV